MIRRKDVEQPKACNSDTLRHRRWARPQPRDNRSGTTRLRQYRNSNVMDARSVVTSRVHAVRVRNSSNATANSAESVAGMMHLQVAAGILMDEAGRVLITERICDGPFNGLWEFPGGKIRSNESSLEALVRELAEEVGIEVIESRSLMSLRHDYSDRSVEIEFFLISDWRSEPVGREGQKLRWVERKLLDSAELLPADVPVVEAIRNL